MAIQLNTRYTGRIAVLLYYERLVDYLIRTMGQQTTATTPDLKPYYPRLQGRKMQNSLIVALRRFLDAVEKQAFSDLQNNPLAGACFL